MGDPKQPKEDFLSLATGSLCCPRDKHFHLVHERGAAALLLAHGSLRSCCFDKTSTARILCQTAKYHCLRFWNFLREDFATAVPW